MQSPQLCSVEVSSSPLMYSEEVGDYNVGVDSYQPDNKIYSRGTCNLVAIIMGALL